MKRSIQEIIKEQRTELQNLLGCEDLVVVTDHESETVQKGDQTVRVVSAQEWLLSF